jgi:hypothetical protein
MFLGHLIYNRRCLFRFGSLCRAAYPHRQACLGYYDRDIYPPAIRRGIELVPIGSVHDQDSADEYPEMGKSTYGDPVEEGRPIVTVAPAEEPSQNSSSRYPTIGISEASDARTLNDRMIQNMNLDFNAICLQTIMESI